MEPGRSPWGGCSINTSHEPTPIRSFFSCLPAKLCQPAGHPEESGTPAWLHLLMSFQCSSYTFLFLSDFTLHFNNSCTRLFYLFVKNKFGKSVIYFLICICRTYVIARSQTTLNIGVLLETSISQKVFYVLRSE